MQKLVRTRRSTSRLFYRDLAVALAVVAFAGALAAGDPGLTDVLFVLTMFVVLASVLLHFLAALRPRS